MIKPGSVGAVVLAAGLSRRMGPVNKLLVEIEGAPIIKRSVAPIVESGLEPVVVVTGFESEKVKSCLSEYNLRFVSNDRYEEGMGTSLGLGAASLARLNLEGIMVTLGDLPYLREDSVRNLLEAFRAFKGNKIIVPYYGESQGHPVVFPIRYIEELIELKGDMGARRLIRRDRNAVSSLELDDIGVVQDVDERAP